MFYLAWQTLFWLILAVLFGIFIGWLIWGRRTRLAGNDGEQLLKQRDENIANLKQRLAQCEQDLVLYKKELEQACQEETRPVLPEGIPFAKKEEADDLKEILGVGPFLENKLNAFGIYTFRQVAALSPNMIQKLGATFGSFSNRIVRENWVEQAKSLHAAKYGEKI